MMTQGPAFAAGPELNSVYTTLQKCKAVSRLELPERTLERAQGVGISRCPGVTNYAIYVIDDDPRSWLVLQHGKHLASLERQMAGEFKLGNFPNVAVEKKLAWRVNRAGRAVGLIVPIFYQRTDVSANSKEAQASALLAFDVRDAQPVLIGATHNNDAEAYAEARRLVDKAMR